MPTTRIIHDKIFPPHAAKNFRTAQRTYITQATFLPLHASLIAHYRAFLILTLFCYATKTLDKVYLLYYTNHNNTTNEQNTIITNNNKSSVASWLDYLHYNVLLRLAQCQTTKGDLAILLDAKWQWAQDTGHYNGYTKEDMFTNIFDLLDRNGLYNVTELTMEKWRSLVK